MNTKIQFEAGNFQEFVLTKTFSLPSGRKMKAGESVMFDGSNLQYEGETFSFPNFRGVISDKVRWAVPVESYDPNEVSGPVSAGIRIRPAQGGNPNEKAARAPIVTVDAEEQEVGDVAAHAKATRDNNASRRMGAAGTRSNTAAESQDGVVVGHIAVPAKQKANIETTSATEATSQSIARRKMAPPIGPTREELLEAMTEEEREIYLEGIEARSRSVEEDPDAAKERAANQQRLMGRRVVSKVSGPKTQEREGFTISNQFGGGVETEDLSGSSDPVETTVHEIEGVRFSNTNIGKPRVASVSAPAVSGEFRRKIAKSICSDFPDNYVFEESSRKKLARLQADYENRPDVIRAVAAAEMADPAFCAQLVAEFPEVFG